MLSRLVYVLGLLSYNWQSFSLGFCVIVLEGSHWGSSYTLRSRLRVNKQSLLFSFVASFHLAKKSAKSSQGSKKFAQLEKGRQSVQIVIRQLNGSGSDTVFPFSYQNHRFPKIFLGLYDDNPLYKQFNRNMFILLFNQCMRNTKEIARRN